MTDQPKPNHRDPKQGFKKDVILWGLFALFVVLSIAAMVAIDVIADAKMGGAHEVHDAAER